MTARKLAEVLRLNLNAAITSRARDRRVKLEAAAMLEAQDELLERYRKECCQSSNTFFQCDRCRAYNKLQEDRQ